MFELVIVIGRTLNNYIIIIFITVSKVIGPIYHFVISAL